jgi:hypothetical protein
MRKSLNMITLTTFTSTTLMLFFLSTSAVFSVDKEVSLLTKKPMGAIAVAGRLDIDLHAEFMLNRTFEGDVALHWYNCGFSGGGRIHTKGGSFGDFGLHVHHSKRADRYPHAIRTPETQLCRFDGNDSMKANFPAEPAVVGNADMCLELWIRDTDPQGKEVILGWQSKDGKEASAPLVYPGKFKGSNKWRHLVVNCSGDTENWYIDGKKVSHGTRKMMIKPGHIMVLGGSTWDRPSFKGDLAAVRLHEKAMTTAEIIHNFKGGVKLGCTPVSWWRTEEDTWWVKESDHFRHCIDKKLMATWKPDSMKKFNERVPKMFELAEKTYRLYSQNLAMRIGVVSSRPEFRGDGIKYKIPIQPTKGGNYMGWDDKRGFGWSCQGPGHINPHEMVHGCQGQTGHMQGNYWEAHANFPQTYLGIYQTVPPLFCSRVSMFFPANGRVYYHARTMFEHLAQSEEYGPMFIAKLWYDGGTEKEKNEYPWSAFERLDPDPSTPLAYEWTRMVQRCVTWDFEIYGDKPKDLYTKDAARDPDQMLRHGRTFLHDDPYNKGWVRPAMEMAPQQLGWNICPLKITGDALTLELSGEIHKERGSDWRAGFVAVDDQGTPHYGAITSNVEKTTFKLKPGTKALYVVVAAIPKKILGIDMTGDFRSFDKERFPYRLRLSGCEPLDYMIPKKSTEQGSKHPHGGGFVAATATVDATAYVGPNAKVLGKAKVLGHARIEDYAIVKDNATVQDDAQVSGYSLVRDRAVIRDHARLRDYAIARGSTIIKDNARLLEHAGGQCKEISGDAVVKGVSWVGGKGLVQGTAMIDGSYRKGNDVNKGIWLTWSWANGHNDGEHDIDLGGLYAQYLFETQHPYLAWDTYGVTHGLVHGKPELKSYPDRKQSKSHSYTQTYQRKKKVDFSVQTAGTAMVFNGKDQFIEVPKALADLRDMMIAFTLKPNGGKPGQRLFEFARDGKTSMLLSPAGKNGKPIFLITVDGKTQMLRSNMALPRGKWATLKIILSDDTGIMQINGKTVAKSKITMNPEDLRATTCTIGCGLEGNFFHGELEDVSIYRTAETSHSSY